MGREFRCLCLGLGLLLCCADEMTRQNRTLRCSGGKQDQGKRRREGDKFVKGIFITPLDSVGAFFIHSFIRSFISLIISCGVIMQVIKERWTIQGIYPR